MEQEPTPLKEKLVTAVRIDHPEASEILVSFPDRWELVHIVERPSLPGHTDRLYLAGLPVSTEEPCSDHFHGLSREINRSLTSYRHYRVFEPWPMPSITVSWNEATASGRVVGGGQLKIQLKPVGEAQAWFGDKYAILWECFVSEAQKREEGWQETLAEIWQAVEHDLGVSTLFTLPHEPAFEGDYQQFIARLGYQPDPESSDWWRKDQ